MEPFRMEADVVGRASRIGVLALHGEAGTPGFDFPFLDRLSDAHRVVAPYLPGSGATPAEPGPLDLDELAAGLVRAADREGLDRFHVVGHSLGATLAVAVAARSPERVERMVLSAGLTHAGPPLRLACGLWRTLLEREPTLQGRFRTWIGSSEAGWRRREDAEDTDIVAEAALSALSTPDRSGVQIDLLGRVDLRRHLPSVTSPTLVVVPERDRLIPPDGGRALGRALPRGRTVTLDSGHDLGAEAPRRWWQELAGHLGLPTARHPA